jgi:hypothetical protein
MKKKVRIGWDSWGLAIYKTIDTEDEAKKEKDSFEEETVIKTKVVTENKPSTVAKKKATNKKKK